MRKTARINRTDFPDGAFQMTKAAAEVVTEKSSEAAGLLTNSLLFCWLVTFKEQCKKCGCFYKHMSEIFVSCF